MGQNEFATVQERKVKAVQLLKELSIFAPYIKEFEENNQVCVFEDFVGFGVDQVHEVEEKMREIEKEYNCTVYAITHEFSYFGECYNFLIVSGYPEDWQYLMRGKDDIYVAFAYVWNKSDDRCSELGSIAVQSFSGGIRRIGIE